jgi:hypothetical protein
MPHGDPKGASRPFERVTTVAGLLDQVSSNDVGVGWLPSVKLCTLNRQQILA